MNKSMLSYSCDQHASSLALDPILQEFDSVIGHRPAVVLRNEESDLVVMHMDQVPRSKLELRRTRKP